MIIFFFSSRRRHTRWPRDWSSDVCSSDLTCQECRAGFEQSCLEGNVGTYNATDVDGTITQGGYAEKVVVNERFVLRIPDSMAFDVAARLLCAGITSYSPLARWGAGERIDGRPKQVAVLGLGGLGHMGVQIAAAMGAEVTVLTRTLRKEKEALELGAARVLATTEEHFLRDLGGRTLRAPEAPSHPAPPPPLPEARPPPAPPPARARARPAAHLPRPPPRATAQPPTPPTPATNSSPSPQPPRTNPRPPPPR